MFPPIFNEHNSDSLHRAIATETSERDVPVHFSMDEHHGYSNGFPMSPSVSAPPTPSSTQLPTTSFKSHLLNLGISSEEIERLLSTYNRQKIAIMEDETICKWLSEDVAISGLVDESKLDLRMRKESSRIEQDCVSAKIRISLAGVEFFHTDKQRHNLIEGLQGPTIHGYERLLDCVSFLIEQTAWQKSNSKRGRRARADCERILNEPQRPSRPALHTTRTTGVRRSERISYKPQRKSARIKKQQKTNVTCLKSKKTV